MVAVLFTVAGDHVPVISLVELPGNDGASLPEHIAAIGAKIGPTVGPNESTLLVSA